MTAPVAGSAGSGDYYARRVASPEYRASRVEKAGVVRRLLGNRLERARRVADIGSGTGIMMKALEAASGRSLLGFELDVDFITERERVVCADATRLPVAGGTFDLLLLNHVYEHVDDQAGLFAEAYRVLAPGGAAYVSAGSRHAVLEPHYRLPFLSWLPRRLADRYLRLSGRGRAYEGVRFLTWRPLVDLMQAPGFRVRDLTETALRELLGPERGAVWRPAWSVLRTLPAGVRGWLLRRGSPQWFFLLEKPGEANDGE